MFPQVSDLLFCYLIKQALIGDIIKENGDRKQKLCNNKVCETFSFRNWERVCKLSVGKVPEGNKNKVVEKVEDFIRKNPLLIIMDIFCKSSEAEWEMEQKNAEKEKKRDWWKDENETR